MSDNAKIDTWPGVAGWHAETQGDCEYHVATVAGGHRAGYVTLNDSGEWVAGVYDRQGNPHVVGSGYSSLYEALRAVDAARNS